MKIPALVALALTLAAAAAAPAAVAPTLKGTVTIASPEPICTAKGCGTPDAPLTLRFRRLTTTRTVRTTPTGAFHATLGPGTWRVSVEQQADATLAPAQVTIRRGVVTRVAFVLRLPRA